MVAESTSGSSVSFAAPWWKRLLSAPHASAGRVPTARGYRVFVDSLLQLSPLGDGEFERLRGSLSPGVGTQSLLGSASELVSAVFSVASSVILAPMLLTAYADMRARHEPFSTAYLVSPE